MTNLSAVGTRPRSVTRVVHCWFVWGILLLAASALRADPGSDALGRSIGLSPASGSLPVWTQPSEDASRQLVGVVKRQQASIILVGSPKVGLGTAWVLSKKNRLLATNAHVADIRHEASDSMIAIGNNTDQVYTIDQVWYHPGVMREINSGFSVRQSDPAVGSVDPLSPDVAVLHVAAGADLPDELTMATPAEVADMFAQPVAMLGFPGHDTSHWPGLGEKAAATLREGVVCRLSDFHGNAGVAPGELQYVQHSMANWFGFSGSPIFLPNGHVVALNNSAKTIKQGDFQTQLAYGIRVDCLWELLAWHGLDSEVPLPIDKSQLLLDRYRRPDESDAKFRQAKQLVADAGMLTDELKFAEAGEKCNQAIELAPGYAAAYDARGRIYHNYVTSIESSTGDIQGEENLRYAKLALADRKKCVQLNPTDNWAYVMFCSDLLSVTGAATGSFENSDVEELLTKLLETENLSPEIRSEAYRFRGQARDYVPEALGDMNAAIALTPFNWYAWEHRAKFWERKDGDQYEADMRRAEELHKAEIANDRAWQLATAPNLADRNGPEAYKLAVEACDASHYEYWSSLLSLSAAYGQCEDYGHAVEYGEKALALAPDDGTKATCRSWRDYFQQQLTLRLQQKRSEEENAKATDAKR